MPADVEHLRDYTENALSLMMAVWVRPMIVFVQHTPYPFPLKFS
jgi:hypothetical protein